MDFHSPVDNFLAFRMASMQGLISDQARKRRRSTFCKGLQGRKHWKGRIMTRICGPVLRERAVAICLPTGVRDFKHGAEPTSAMRQTQPGPRLIMSVVEVTSIAPARKSRRLF